VADYDEVIPPGSEGKINVRLIGSKLPTGKFKKSYTVKTNDPENEKVILYVSGNVQKIFELSKTLSLTGYRNEEPRDEVILTSTVETPIAITGHHWSDKTKERELLDKAIGVKVTTLEKGKKYKLETWLRKQLPPNQYFADIVLETDFEKLPQKLISLRVQVMDDVEVHPNSIYMHELLVPEGTSQSFEKAVSVIAARGDSLKILEIAPSDKTITYNLREIKPGKAYTIRFQIRPPSIPGKYEATLSLKTNYKGYETLEVPIRGAVRIVQDGK
jgi:hypothetical protein